MSNSRHPTANELLDAIEQVSEMLGKRPTTLEFNTHTEYDTNHIYQHFDSWDDAVESAETEAATREDLLADLRRLESELGFAPLSTHVNQHGKFWKYDYRKEFGSVTDALDEAGLDLEAHVVKTIREVVEEAEGKPTTADFGEKSPYSSGIIYAFFDSWSEAVATVSRDESPPENSVVADSIEESAPSSDSIETNELAELYDLICNLHELCSAVRNLTAERQPDSDPSDPMTQWAREVDAFWQSGPPGTTSYGEQQADRNTFSIRQYRDLYGNGDRVTEFNSVSARPLSLSVRELLSPHLDVDAEEILLPVDPESRARLPVIVETETELTRAVEMLHRLPSRPMAEQETTPPTSDEEESSVSSRNGESDEGRTTDSGSSNSELLEVNGVTHAIVDSLREAGYQTRNDLQAADTADLKSVDGISEQTALRIKLDVGG